MTACCAVFLTVISDRFGGFMSCGDGSLVQQKSQRDLSHRFQYFAWKVCVDLEDDKPTCPEWQRNFPSSQYTVSIVPRLVPSKPQGITEAQICCSMNALYVYDALYSATTYHVVDSITLLYHTGNITQLRLGSESFRCSR